MIVRHHFPRTVYVLPIGYHPFRWMGMHYSFYNGFFFRPYGGAFIICRPPIGFVIAATTLRTAPLTPVIFNPTIVIYGHPQQHYYNEGTYYVRVSPSEYKVVVPPIGARVFSIPEDSEEFILDGYTYYRVDDTYYALVYVDGATMFEVVGRDER